MPHFYIRCVFVIFFILWAAIFYLCKVKNNQELKSDGVWWVPYFLVIGLGILALTEKYTIVLSVKNWGNFVLCSFLIVICAILFFWEWPPWFDKNKTLLGKGKRTLLAYLFLIPGLIIWIYAGTCLINVSCDHSQPVAHDSIITDKAVVNHKYTSDTDYIILVKPWSKHIQSNSFLVSSQDFQHAVPDSTVVRIWTKEGFFHFQWITGIKILL